MSPVLDRLVDKISMAPIDPVPAENIYMEDIFESEIYSSMIANLPAEADYDFIKHHDAVLPDGTITRKLLALSPQTISRISPAKQAFWLEIEKYLSSEELQKALLYKFHREICARFGNDWPEMVTVPILYRDYPGYRISIHPDGDVKVATLQFYLPPDDSQIHLGTSFHVREGSEFKEVKTNPFKPNSAYAFVRTENSWHSVKELGSHESIRNTLALTIFLKGKEYIQPPRHM